MGRIVSGRIVIATHSAGKLREISAMLSPYGVEAVSAGDLGLAEPAETGMMFSENAAIKARAAVAASGLPALADDSGFCVDALDGAPGLFTADWAGNPRDYGKAMGAVERELALRGVGANGAAAHFTCAMVMAWPDGEELLFEGRCRGTVAWPPKYGRGFGFDPMFVPEGKDVTFAEMSDEEKEGAEEPLSHRARALAAFARACLQRR